MKEYEKKLIEIANKFKEKHKKILLEDFKDYGLSWFEDFTDEEFINFLNNTIDDVRTAVKILFNLAVDLEIQEVRKMFFSLEKKYSVIDIDELFSYGDFSGLKIEGKEFAILCNLLSYDHFFIKPIKKKKVWFISV